MMSDSYSSFLTGGILMAYYTFFNDNELSKLSLFIYKIECALNTIYKVSRRTFKMSKDMRLFSAHITKLWNWLRKLVFCNCITCKTSFLKKNRSICFVYTKIHDKWSKNKYWNHLLQLLPCWLIPLPYILRYSIPQVSNANNFS